MLEAARLARRSTTRTRQPVWGPVDAILALVLLPFGVWVLAIDLLVAGLVRLFSREPRLPERP